LRVDNIYIYIYIYIYIKVNKIVHKSRGLRTRRSTRFYNFGDLNVNLRSVELLAIEIGMPIVFHINGGYK